MNGIEINSNGTTLIMVTHDPELANRASRQIHLLDGKLIDVVADQPAPLFQPGGGLDPAEPSPA